jgi:hypothetical protein
MHDLPAPFGREVFILRLWRESAGQFAWRGQIQHVQSGQIVNIKSPEELLAYLKQQVMQQIAKPSSNSGLK